MAVLLDSLGIKYTRRGLSLVALCPNPDHTDQKPSWSIVDAPYTGKHGGHQCFSCKFGGGPWELVMAARGIDEDAAREYVTALTLGRPRRFEGLPEVKIISRVKRQYELPPQVVIPHDWAEYPHVFASYIESRGITPEQCERWRIGYATRGSLAWRLVIPIHTSGKLAAYVARAIFQDRPRYDMPTAKDGACPHGAIFGEPLINFRTEILTLAEGVFSALALERAIAPNPCALLGSDWSPLRAAILTRHRWSRVIIATDPDPAGDRVAASIAASFRNTKIVRLRCDRSPDDMESVALREAVNAALAEP